MNLASMFIVVLLTGSLALQTARTAKQKSRTPNSAPVIKSFTASSPSVCAKLRNCPVIAHGRTTLTTVASDPDGDVLTYRYSIPAGRIEGTGATVVWNLEKQKLGAYTAVVTVKDQKGNKTRASVIVRADICYLCDPPPCPMVSVACPSEVESGKPITFFATVSNENDAVSYSWRTDAGRIVEGKRDNKMTLDLKRSSAERVTGTVKVGGYNRLCQTTASCTVRIKQ